MYKKLILNGGCLVGLFFLLFLFYWIESPIFKNFFFNADVLYLPVLFKNLFEQNGHIGSWYLTPAPYFFPDFIMFLPTYLLGRTPSIQMVYFAFFQSALLAVFLYFFFKSMLNLSNSTLTGCALFATSALLGLALQAELNPYSYVLVSAFHYGSFLIEIVCLTLVVQWFKIPSNNASVIALCGLLLLMTCSDALFLVQCVLPMMLSLAIVMIYCPVQRSKTNVTRLLLPIGFALIGFLMYPKLTAHPTRYPGHLGLSVLKNNVHEIKIIFYDLFQTFPVVSSFLVIFYVSTLFICLIILIKKSTICTRIRNTLYLIFLSFFTLLSMFIPIVIMLFMDQFIPTSRYFIPIVSLPIIMGIAYLAMLSGKHAYLFMIGGAFIILGYLSFQAVHLYQSDRVHSTGYYPQEIACIDQSLAQYPSLRHGIAQYWDAKFIQAYSRRNLVIAQSEKNLHEYRWITSEQFYQSAYDFAVINTDIDHPDFILSRERLVQYNAAPLEERHCGKYIILIYSKNKLKTRPIVYPGDRVSWKASELPFVLGHPTKNGAIHADHVKKTEFVTYGPYEPLPAGLYEFEISYRSSKPNHKQAGTWDIVSAEAHPPKVFQQGIYWGTKGQIQRIKGIFSISSKYRLTKIEIRTKAFPGKWVQVNQLMIQRLK